MEKDLGIAIIGSGGISKSHAMAYQNFAGAFLLAFCDIDAEKAKNRAKEFGCQLWYADYQKLLQNPDVDVVSVCVPTRFHAEVTVAAAEAGKHVLCEKAMAWTLADCDRMIDAAKRNNIKLSVVFQNRFNRNARRLKKLIDDGKMGKIIMGEFYSWSVHVTDVFRWLMGTPERISSEWCGENRLYRGTLTSVVRFQNEAIGIMNFANLFNPPFTSRERSLKIIGEKMNAFFVLFRDYWELEASDQSYLEEVRAEIESEFTQPEYSSRDPELHNVGVYNFLSAIVEDRDPFITGEEGRKAVEMYVGAYKSVFEKKPVSFPIEKSDEVYGKALQPVAD